ncbi:hemolysin family protein [Halegenticoccus tardaugens]|uniref:hemolysin family protein n=1 Tax=Halegenticoccus tardaugens TaxID=2071624 RepID=UPI00100B0650|nr:hemolysin family protein [Halegenticoccus tardaugens]
MQIQAMDATLLGAVAAVVVLLAFSAFFSSSEIALFSLERHRLDTLFQRRDARTDALRRLREDPHRLLVTILVGNNIVNIAIASIATAALVDLLGAGVAVSVATVAMSFLILVFGEITPKSYGVAHAESLSLRVARPLAFVQTALYPLVVFFDAVTRAINRLTGGGRDIERPYVTREEIEALLRTGERVGAIEETEHEMVRGVFDLSSTRAREVMVPRVDVIGVDAEAPLDEVLDVCSSNRLTRLPVYEGTIDRVVGIADVRDVERAVREELSLRDVLLPTIGVPDGREIDGLLAEMQERRVPMVVVHDEFGEVEGIITVEDILEEIVGEIFEVGEERFIRPTADGLLVKGEVTVGEVNDALDVDLPIAPDFETVAGLINAELGRLGDVGDEVALTDVSLRVDAVDGNRITLVRVRRLTDRGGGKDEPDAREDGADG